MIELPVPDGKAIGSCTGIGRAGREIEMDDMGNGAVIDSRRGKLTGTPDGIIAGDPALRLRKGDARAGKHEN